jgi:hypothetical protein
VITGPELEGLQEYSDALMARLREEVPGITDMRTDMRLQKPEVRVELDAIGRRRDRSALQRRSTRRAGTGTTRVRVEEAAIQPAEILALSARTESGELVRLETS